MMRAMPDMKHVEPNGATVRPGKRGGLIWQFDEAGVVDFACLVPGHFEAGMVGRIEVE
ncbi:MAG TPA: plastocyanin/azurin family copper-binding protein [Burkholderiales bacterium]